MRQFFLLIYIFMSSNFLLARPFSDFNLKPISTKSTKDQLLPIFENENIDAYSATLRLIVSETIATHCEFVNNGDAKLIQSIMNGVAQVIYNRIQSHHSKNALEVIFKKDQFNSSVAKYKCSEINSFLNPQLLESKFGKLSLNNLFTMADSAYENAESNTSVTFEKSNLETKSYYLHQHGQKGDCNFKAPKWVNPKHEVNLNIKEEKLKEPIRKCIGFYRLPSK